MYRGLAFRLFFSRVLLRFLLRSIVPLPAKGNFVAVAAVDVQLYCEHDRVVTVCGRNFVVLLGLPRQSLALAPNGSACKSISLRSISSGLCMSMGGNRHYQSGGCPWCVLVCANRHYRQYTGHRHYCVCADSGTRVAGSSRAKLYHRHYTGNRHYSSGIVGRPP